MRLKTLEINGFKSFASKTILEFDSPVVSVVGPNGSGKSNVVESIRFVLGEQSIKSMRGKTGSDLIFKGSKNLPKGSRASVSIYFDNSDKVFKLSNNEGENVNLNFDTINISREVFSDGLNKYMLNGTEVRLRDIHNLLASVNIGSSGHHIISQGEADRVLNANARDRREMVEDALGLKVYQYKIKESEKKLERTNENMKEVTLLRRENAPHLNFLRKQVEKFEKIKEMQSELVILYKEYLKREHVYLEQQKNILEEEKNKISFELREVSLKIVDDESQNNKEGNQKIQDLRVIEQKLNELRNLKGEMGRKLGRVEGMIEGEERRLSRGVEISPISIEEVHFFVKEMHVLLDEAIFKEDLSGIKLVLHKIKDILHNFTKNKQEKDTQNNYLEINNLKNTQAQILEEMKVIEVKEGEVISQINLLKEEINKEVEALRDLEKEKFKWKVRHQELTSALELVVIKENNLKIRYGLCEEELKEGVALVGHGILSFNDFEISLDENVSQDELKRKIERIKIKLEDAGMGNGAELMKEFKDMTARDEFLVKELEDLTKSIEALKALIADLKEKIDIEFKEGIKKINVEFQEFFALMFGGGYASLKVVVENKKPKRVLDPESEGEVLGKNYEDYENQDADLVLEKGIEIDISLPHKKVKELQALSGGERSLTSIALLFAMSQVNPPPFLVLDETDAALDEANSRKYGDMIEKLSEHSQLIVVTHNRETMSRAGVLYGVTIGNNGASKLLSVKFDEAAAIAK